MPAWTGVGSRDTPDDVLSIMEVIGKAYAEKGWVLRSGAAEGADSAFERGVLSSNHPDRMEIYLPWRGFGRRRESSLYRDAKLFDNYAEAMSIAENIHPYWSKCSYGARCLHTRNVYQVLGEELKNPSVLIVYWAMPTTSGSVNGGTRTAVELARLHNIPEINLYYEDARALFLAYVQQTLGKALPG